MSAWGHLQTFAEQKAMSALPLKANIKRCENNVGYGPKADMTDLIQAP